MDDVDVVGITCMTADANRAYTIADQYRQLGIATILGGIHPTALPQEASTHATSVVVGEAENIIQELIADARNREVKQFYHSSIFHDLKCLPNPRRDLLDERYYSTTNVIQASRGCPYNCEFCSVGLVAGHHYRFRPVEDVAAEISASDGQFWAFLDDNIAGNPNYAAALFSALRPLNIHWFGSCSVPAAGDPNLCRLAASSGCKVLLIGFESLSQVSLASVNKRFNSVDRFYSVVKNVHDHGIGIIGTFMLGLDGGVDEADRIVDFALRARLDMVQIAILTPYPGTKLFETMQAQGRLLTTDWTQYDTAAGTIVFQPSDVTTSALREAYFNALERLYSPVNIARRLLGSRRYFPIFVPYNLRQRHKIRLARALSPHVSEA
jgi:radical SAM superfamily enzyme YgiQ (UPF0313 family)